MRFIIYGAGGIGGTIGARLFETGHDVVLIGRGEHLEAIRREGLRFRTPESDAHIPIPAVSHPREVDWQRGDVVLLTMKTQDTEGALRDLESVAGPDVPVFCAQNGVENERLAARRFANVYAMLVALPATFLVAGEVIASASPLSGCLHAGRYPGSVDSVVSEVCAALATSRFHAEPCDDVMALKYRKLVLNLGNGVELITGQPGWSPEGETQELVHALREEAMACYSAAGIASTPPDEYVERVTRHYRAMPVGGEARTGSSTLQSVLRGRPTNEVDYLNGEIVLLGSLHGVPTPFNSAVRTLAAKMAATGAKPGAVTVAEVMAMARR